MINYANRVLAVMILTMIIGAPANAENPNFVLIMADDFGYADIGSYGSPIRTPNIDAIVSALTWKNRSAKGPALATASFFRDKYAWVGIDVTPFVQAEQQGDGIASFAWQPTQDGPALVLERAKEQEPTGGVLRTAFLRAYLP